MRVHTLLECQPGRTQICIRSCRNLQSGGGGQPNWVPMMSRDASFSYGCTPDRCIFFQSGCHYYRLQTLLCIAKSQTYIGTEDGNFFIFKLGKLLFTFNFFKIFIDISCLKLWTLSKKLHVFFFIVFFYQFQTLSRLTNYGDIKCRDSYSQQLFVTLKFIWNISCLLLCLFNLITTNNRNRNNYNGKYNHSSWKDLFKLGTNYEICHMIVKASR